MIASKYIDRLNTIAKSKSTFDTPLKTYVVNNRVPSRTCERITPYKTR